MRHKQLLFPSVGGKRELYGQLWLPDGPPRCLVQLIPDLGGAADYSALADYLQQQGAGLAVHDHLSGFHSAPRNGLAPGQLPPHFGWKQLLADCHGFTRQLRAFCPQTPLLLWGEGSGAWLATCLLEEDGWPYTASVLVTAPDPGRSLRLASLLSVGAELHRDREANCALFQRWAWAVRRGRFQTRHGALYWLLHKEDTGFPPLSLALCRALLVGARQGREHSSRLRSDLPLLLAAGSEDDRTWEPGYRRAYQRLCSHGLDRVELYLFRDCRSELLERGQSEVWSELWRWSEQQLKYSRRVQACLQTI